MDEKAYLRAFLEDYLRQKGIPLTKAFRCLSPSHEDKHPSMRYNRAAKTVHCFSCGVTYDIFDLVGLDYGLDSFPLRLEKVRSLFDPGSCTGMVSGFTPTHVSEGGAESRQYRGASTRRAGPDQSSAKIKAFPNPNHPPKSGDSKGNHSLWRGSGGSVPTKTQPKDHAHPSTYLLSRGLTAETCLRHGVFEKDGRVWFPIYQAGRLMSHCGRALSDETQPRYRNSSGPMGLWNADRIASLAAGDVLCVTEGIIDALSLEQLGYPAVSLCGSQNQGKLLRALEKLPSGVKLILCGDPDPAGQKMNDDIMRNLPDKGISFTVLKLDETDEDVNALLVRDTNRLVTLLSDAKKEKPEDIDGEGDCSYAGSCASAAIESFFLERERRRTRGAPSTGLPGLDKLLGGGLYPGLYVMGAISSLGKTSLALQIADYIAGQEEDVLFFSLEQSRFELMAKSLSRICLSMTAGKGKAPSASEILRGEGDSSLLLEAAEVYAQGASGLFLRESLGEIGAAELRQEVERHKAHRGTAPVVVVDYLQILKPSDPRASDKQNTDRAVTALKRLSRDFDIPVLAISSFNRENYKAQASMEAFKESGAVEYSADVLLGLQLCGAGDRNFDAAKEKLKNPRPLELVMLKNRQGIPWAKLPLLFDAKYNAFWEGRENAVDLPAWAVK